MARFGGLDCAQKTKDMIDPNGFFAPPLRPRACPLEPAAGFPIKVLAGL
jgi:hypothetical protein